MLTFLMRVSLVGCSMESSPRLALKQSFFARSVIEFNMNLKTVALRVPVSTADCPSLSSGRRNDSSDHKFKIGESVLYTSGIYGP